ncbi:hypothetical protein BH11CYA1_BH11CYA1_29490 [soil metagenome]
MAALILALLEDHINAKQVKTCLENCGYDVTVTDSFVKAKALLASQKADLVISDVHLENGGDVFDFLRWIKKNKKTSHIPFVLFSSQPSPRAKILSDGVRTTSRILGAAKYIEMDIFDSAEFISHIQELVPINK